MTQHYDIITYIDTFSYTNLIFGKKGKGEDDMPDSFLAGLGFFVFSFFVVCFFFVFFVVFF